LEIEALGNAMAGEQRRLAAFVATDVAGYSSRMGGDESGTLAALKALRREVVDPRIAEHGGVSLRQRATA
jgi:class 3 adenylate cyclase